MPQLFGEVRNERCDHAHHRVGNSSGGGALVLGEFVVEFGDAGDRRIEAERVHVAADRVDGSVQRLVQGIRDIDVGDGDFARFFVDEVAPDALEQTQGTNDRLGFPRPVLVDGAHEHFVEAQGVRAVVAIHVIGSDGVLEALAHLAVLAGHRLTLEGVVIAGFNHVGCVYVDASVVFECVGLDVALVDEALERFHGTDNAQVVEHLVPEAGIEQMQHRVFDATDVKIDAALGRALAAHPVLLRRGVGDGVFAHRVDVAQVVPARSRPLRHDVEITGVGLGAVTEVDIDVAPLFGATEWRLWFGVFIELTGSPIDEFGKIDRKVFIGERDWIAVVIEDDRDRFTPISLACKQPVTELGGDRTLTSLDFFEVFDHRGFGFVDNHAVEEAAVDGRPVAGVGLAGVEVEVAGRLNRANDVEVERFGELPITLVLARYRHDGAGAVTHEYVVGDKHRDRLVVDRVHGKAAGKHTGLFFVFLTVTVAQLRCALPVSVYRFSGGGVSAGPGILGAVWPGVFG